VGIDIMARIKRDWDKVLTDLQFKEITAEDMPRLFYECLIDRLVLMEKTVALQKAIEELQTKMNNIMEVEES